MPSMSLTNKFNVYLKFLSSQQDSHGFIVASGCDSLLFSSLIGCVKGVDVDIDSARVGDIWFRHPINYSGCTCDGYMRSVWQRTKDCLKLAWSQKSMTG